MKKKKDFDWIRGFSKISVSSVCKDLKLNKANVLMGTASDKSISLVKKTIEERLRDLDNDEEFSQHIPRID